MRRLGLIVGGVGLGAVAALVTALALPRDDGSGKPLSTAVHDPVALRACLERSRWSDIGEIIPGYVDVLVLDSNYEPQRDLVVAYGSQAGERLAVGVREALMEWDIGEVKVKGEAGDVAWAATGESAIGSTRNKMSDDADETVRDLVSACLNRSTRMSAITRKKHVARPPRSFTPAGTTSREWRITDLGTLGGSKSWAVAINDRGELAGTSYAATEYGDPHAFVSNGRGLRDLGTGGGFTSNAVAINDRGQIIGERVLRSGDTQVFLWQGGRTRDVGPPSHYGNAVAINRNAQIIATAGLPRSSFIWSRGHMTNVAALETVTGINDRGQVVGGQIVWENGSTRSIGTAWARPGRAVAINNRGQVVGDRTIGNRYFDWTRAFLWQDGHTTDLATLPGRRACSAVAINDGGEVAGVCGIPVPSQGPTEHDHAVVWKDKEVIDIGTLDTGADLSVATAINAQGWVVGRSETAEGTHAFVWKNGRTSDLGTLPGGTRSEAVAINDHGQVVGSSTTATGEQHAVLWAPRAT